MKMLFVGIGPLTDIVNWMVWHIAQNSQIQEQIRNEIHTVIGIQSRKDKNKNNVNKSAVGVDSLNSFELLHKCMGGTTDEKQTKDKKKQVKGLRYLDATYRETLRMYSPVHVGRLSVVPQNVGGFDIPAGSDVMTNMHFIHRSPKNYENPHVFDPGRFSGQTHNNNNYHKKEDKNKNGSQLITNPNGGAKNFFPFSIGPRSCPGSQISGCLAKLFVVLLVSK